jgi:hypothetical protein
VWCVSECDREASIMRRPWPTGGCCAIGHICTIKPLKPKKKERNVRSRGMLQQRGRKSPFEGSQAVPPRRQGRALGSEGGKVIGRLLGMCSRREKWSILAEFHGWRAVLWRNFGNIATAVWCTPACAVRLKKTKERPKLRECIKIQSVPRSKHTPSRL